MFPVRRKMRRSDWGFQKNCATFTIVALIIFLIMMVIKFFRRIEMLSDAVSILGAIAAFLVLYNMRRYFHRMELESPAHSND